jgi:hypothetical protein
VDPALVHDAVKTLNMFSLVFGIPLSFGALLTGLALGLGTRWGRVQVPVGGGQAGPHRLGPAVGGLVIAPAGSQMLDGDADTTGRLIAAASYDVAALTLATAPGVIKPGRRFRRTARDRR